MVRNFVVILNTALVQVFLLILVAVFLIPWIKNGEKLCLLLVEYFGDGGRPQTKEGNYLSYKQDIL